MIQGFGWTSPPIRTIEVPAPDAEPMEVPEPGRLDETRQPEPVPAGAP